MENNPLSIEYLNSLYEAIHNVIETAEAHPEELNPESFGALWDVRFACEDLIKAFEGIKEEFPDLVE